MGVNRVTGLNSGLDTESLVTSLVSSYQKKVDTLTGNQKRHSWKQDAWKDLNKKVVSFYNGKINTMSYASAFNKKTTTSTNSKAVTILTGSNAMNATQRMRVEKTATSAFATGKEIKVGEEYAKGDTKISDLCSETSTYMEDVLQYEEVQAKDSEGNLLTNEDGSPKMEKVPVMVDKLDEEGNPIQKKDANGNPVVDEEGNPVYEQVQKTVQEPRTGYSLTITIGNGKSETLNFAADATLNDVANKLKGLTVDGQKFNANYDSGQGRFYVAAESSGSKGTFTFSSENSALLGALGLDSSTHEGQDAVLWLNDEKYTSATGTFEINGLTITANEVTEEEFTITTKSDTSGVYDMIKDMVKEYNELIKELDTKYYADPAKKYNMLTDDERYAMSEKEVEEWDQHIKDGLLAKDSTVYDLSQALKSILQGGFEVNGKRMYLSDFGIGTGAYLSTSNEEQGMLHIDGDPDDSLTSTNADKLKALIASDPDTVTSFFSQLAQGMRSKLFDMMKATEYSSSFTVYEDKLMASQYSDYNTKIANATDRLNKKQDAYYAKFTRMEKAMAKTNSVQSNLSGYFGGG